MSDLLVLLEVIWSKSPEWVAVGVLMILVLAVVAWRNLKRLSSKVMLLLCALPLGTATGLVGTMFDYADKAANSDYHLLEYIIKVVGS